MFIPSLHSPAVATSVPSASILAVCERPIGREITRTTELPIEPPAPGYTNYIGPEPELVDGDIQYVDVWEIEGDSFDSFLPVSTIVRYDTETSSAERVSVDERCGGLTGPATGPDGKLYSASRVAVAASFAILPDRSFRPCMLRKDPGAAEFDQDWIFYLDELGGSGVFGTIFPGGDGSALIQEFDPSLVELDRPLEFTDIVFSESLLWRRLDLETFTLEDMGMPPSSEAFVAFEIDGTTYLPNRPEGETVFFNTESTPATAGLTVPGGVRGFARVPR